MSLFEPASGSASAAHDRAEPPLRNGTIKPLMTVVALASVAAVTLAWVGLLLRGGLWLIGK